MYEIAGKAALVTGGTRGIGLAIASRLLDSGASVVVNGRSPTPECDELRREASGRLSFEPADISDPDAARGLVESTAARYGRIDIVVHAAGGPVPGKATEITPQVWADAFRVHVDPVFHLFRAAHPHLAREGGAVVLISSVAGLRGCPGSVAYQTVKGALPPLARALAFDHAAEKIRVNVVAPGPVRTRFHENMSEAARLHNVSGRIPLRREGVPEDVADAALALIRNDFITGEVLAVDGGLSMRITG